jgi:hypothetical protein
MAIARGSRKYDDNVAITNMRLRGGMNNGTEVGPFTRKLSQFKGRMSSTKRRIISITNDELDRLVLYCVVYPVLDIQQGKAIANNADSNRSLFLKEPYQNELAERVRKMFNVSRERHERIRQRDSGQLYSGCRIGRLKATSRRACSWELSRIHGG